MFGVKSMRKAPYLVYFASVTTLIKYKGCPGMRPWSSKLLLEIVPSTREDKGTFMSGGPVAVPTAQWYRARFLTVLL